MLRTATLCAVLGAFTLCSCARRSYESSRRLNATEVGDRAKPATVTVIAEYECEGTVPHYDIDADKLGEAVRQKTVFFQSDEEKLKAAFNLLLDDPGAYLKAGNELSLKKTIASHGTGAIVTPDGYVLTNAHVVNPEKEDLNKAVVESISELVDDDVNAVEQAIEKLLPGSQMNANARDHLAQVLAEHYARSANVQFSRSVYAVMSSTKGGNNLESLGKRCEVQQPVGKRIPGKDIAVLKMEGSDFPTLPLAESLEDSEVTMGSDLYVVGYPGTVALNTDFSVPSRLTPSMTVGHVSAIREMADGWKVIQTDAPINPGNSGGPALNDRGKVVGLATFSLKDTQGVNFVVSVDVAKEFLKQANVQPSESMFTKTYVQALNDYERNDNKRALILFKYLEDRHPDSAVVQDFVQEISRKIGEPADYKPPVPERDDLRKTTYSAPTTTHSSGHPLLVFLVIAGLLTVVITFVVLANRA